MKHETNNYGIGFVGLLQIVFIVLKLIKVIDWSWWWVVAPTWMFAGLVILIILILLLIMLIKEGVKK